MSRRRELLLSLKYSTIEACFSVPMLNLTMPSFPFVIAFAVTVLGWGPAAVGAMAALPHLCNLVQPPVALWLRRRLPLFQIMALTFLLSALPWGFVSVLPFETETVRHATFAAILVVATFANSLGSVAWAAAIAELVPARMGGNFYGRRNLVFGFWTLLVVIVASVVAARSHNSMVVFGWIFATAGLARLIGFFFLTRMRFPRSVTERAPDPPGFSEIALPFRNRNYLRLVAFVGVWGFLLNLGQPFYPVFIVQGLHRSVADVGILTAIAGVGGLLTLRSWGWMCGRFGSKPVLQVCAILWAVAGLAAWTFAGERFFWHLAPCYLVVGGTTACFQLCQFNLMLKLAPANKAPYVAVFLALTSALTALGPILGGLVLRWVPDVLGTFLGQTIRDYHVLIAVSMVGCLLSTHLLAWVDEPEAHAPEEVWRTMSRMQPFNPMLILGSAAQLIVSPAGLMAMAHQSVRLVRRQMKAIGNVGEVLVDGTTEAIRSRLPGDSGE